MGARLQAKGISAIIPRAPNGQPSQSKKNANKLAVIRAKTAVEIEKEKNRTAIEVMQASALGNPVRRPFGKNANSDKAGYALGRIILRNKLKSEYQDAANAYYSARVDLCICNNTPIPGFVATGNGIYREVSRSEKDKYQRIVSSHEAVLRKSRPLCETAVRKIVWEDGLNCDEGVWDQAVIQGLTSLINYLGLRERNIRD